MKQLLLHLRCQLHRYWQLQRHSPLLLPTVYTTLLVLKVKLLAWRRTMPWQQIPGA